jgi:hypothetical protein
MYLEFLFRLAHSRKRVDRRYWSGESLYSRTTCSNSVTVGVMGPIGSGLPQFGFPRRFAIRIQPRAKIFTTIGLDYVRKAKILGYSVFRRSRNDSKAQVCRKVLILWHFYHSCQLRGVVVRMHPLIAALRAVTTGYRGNRQMGRLD